MAAKLGLGLYQHMLDDEHLRFTPQMTCAAPWHAGVAYAMGYLRAALSAVERGAV